MPPSEMDAIRSAATTKKPPDREPPQLVDRVVWYATALVIQSRIAAGAASPDELPALEEAVTEDEECHRARLLAARNECVFWKTGR
jgi:hypothetical protein